MTAARDFFGELRDRLDVRDLAEGEGLGRRGRNFDCPACTGRLKAMSRDGRGWFCVKCEAKGDAVDLLAAVRRLDLSEARRVGLRLAGLEGAAASAGAPLPPAPPRRPEPPAPILTRDDGEERARALALAAQHYLITGGWFFGLRAGLPPVTEDSPAGACDPRDVPGPDAHVAFLVDLCGFPPSLAHRLEVDAAKASAYATQRLRRLADDPGLGFRARVEGLIGACPSARTGLAEYLRHFGGAALVEASKRAGLLHADGSETLAGRLVYVWTDARGRAVYLTGRTVPALVEAGAVACDAKKAHALPIFGSGERPERGVWLPHPRPPFALHRALAMAAARPGAPIAVVEGELDALALILAGVPAVATGGTSRTPAADLAALLARRRVVVAFDFGAETPEKQAETDDKAGRLAADLARHGVDASVKPSAELKVALAHFFDPKGIAR